MKILDHGLVLCCRGTRISWWDLQCGSVDRIREHLGGCC